MSVYDYKKRTKFGRFIDQKHITQQWVINVIGLDKKTVYRLCNDLEYNPHDDTQTRIISKLRREGFDVMVADFW